MLGSSKDSEDFRELGRGWVGSWGKPLLQRDRLEQWQLCAWHSWGGGQGGRSGDGEVVGGHGDPLSHTGDSPLSDRGTTEGL